MRFGLTTPVVTMVPRTHAAWERDAGSAEIHRIAATADRLGYHHLSCSEHVGIPVDVADTHRGGRYYDPAATLGFVAAVHAADPPAHPRPRAALPPPARGGEDATARSIGSRAAG